MVAGGEDTSSAALAIGVTHRELGLLSLWYRRNNLYVQRPITIHVCWPFRTYCGPDAGSSLDCLAAADSGGSAVYWAGTRITV